MIAVLQRVSSARVDVEGKTVGAIGPGLLVLVCAEQGDTQAQGDKLLAKILKLRIFNDAHGKMNHSLQDMDGAGTAGGLLIVSQFTLAADTERGMRPGFSKGAAPERAEALYEYFVERCRQQEMNTQTGRFAADMQVSLVNDGPVTFWLQV